MPLDEFARYEAYLQIERKEQDRQRKRNQRGAGRKG